MEFAFGFLVGGAVVSFIRLVLGAASREAEVVELLRRAEITPRGRNESLFDYAVRLSERP